MKILIVLVFLLFTKPIISFSQHWESLNGGTEAMGVVFSMFEHNNDLIVGGSFSTIGGGTIPSMITGVWNGAIWSSTPWNIQQGSPKDHIIYNNKLHIGGNFTRISGNKYCNKVARLDSSGWMPLGSGVTNGEVRAMASYNGDLYVGGTFTIVDSTISASRIARWDGNDWHAIGNGITGGFGEVNCMAVFQNQLYIAGDYGAIDGMPAKNICRWNGSSWDSVDTGVFGLVFSMYVDSINNRLYVGGIFAQTGIVPTPTGVAYWDGVNWHPAGTEPFVPARCLIKHNGILYNGTTQTGITNTLGDTIKNICWLDGNIWRNVGNGISAEPVVFSEFQNELYIGGYFTYAGDSLVNGIAKWIPGSLGVGGVMNERLRVKIIPNPAKNKINLTFGQPLNERVDVAIYNAKGDMILRKQFTGVQEQITIDLPVGSKSGMYLCKITGKGIEMSGKFVIE